MSKSNIPNMKSIYLFVLVSFISISAFSQYKADKLFESYDYRAAYDVYLSQLKKDDSNIKIINRLGECSYLINNYARALEWYDKSDDLKGLKDIHVYYYARTLQFDNQLNKANVVMQRHIDSGKTKWTKNPIMRKTEFITLDEYKTLELGSNSVKSDFGPCYYGDKLIFTSGRDVVSLVGRKNKWENQDYLRLYVGDVDKDGLVKEVDRFSELKNDKFNDGPVCFSADGNEMFITRNNLIRTKKDKYYGLKIYYTKKINGDWSEPVLMSFNKNKYSYGHPSLSDDGQKLYFISNDSLGFGQTDIYVSTRKGDSWSEAINLGNKINSPRKEMTPFISENKILFFSSDGHPGAGGLDVFRANVEKKGDARNLGASVNTNFDDFGFIVKNKDAYLCSNREGGESFDNLYRLSVVSFKVFGALVDKLNSPLPDFLVELRAADGSLIASTTSDENGKYSFVVNRDQKYSITTKKPEYKDLTSSLDPKYFLSSDPKEIVFELEKDLILLANTEDLEASKQEYLSSMVKALKIIIHYDFDRSIIRDEDIVKMKNAVRFINTNDEYKLQIESHTDSKGSNEYNLALSLRRAKSIKSKFEKLGINKNRISSIGRGERYLLNDLITDELDEDAINQLNRRSEIQILFKGNTVSVDKYKEALK